MDSILSYLEKFIPFLEKYDAWVKWVVGCWILLTAITLIVLLFARKTSKSGSIADVNPKDTGVQINTKPAESNPLKTFQWKETGDDKIDIAVAELNQLEKSGRENINESDLVKFLNPMFTRPAFYPYRKGNSLNTFLYPLCRSRIMLEHYQSYFKSPDIRIKIQEAIHLMVQLQNNVAEKIYAPTFSIDSHIKEYINDSKAFINNLPNKIKEADFNFLEECNQHLFKINDALSHIGLMDSY